MIQAQLVCDSSRVDYKGLSTFATVIEGLSLRLLDVVADAQSLKVLYGDIGIAFIQAHTKEKIFTCYGSEFGPRADSIAIIVQFLYRLLTSTEMSRITLANLLRTIDFKPSHYD